MSDQTMQWADRLIQIHALLKDLPAAVRALTAVPAGTAVPELLALRDRLGVATGPRRACGTPWPPGWTYPFTGRG
jgi:hypothetical protein